MQMNAFSLVQRQLRRGVPLSPNRWQRQASPRTLTPPFTSKRNFSERPKKTPEEPAKPKPKASTPLRRAASASLPIRANPTPTRSDIHPIFTYATAERYLMPRLRAALPDGAVLLHDAWWVPRWTDEGSGKEGEVFVFGNGSFVCWGLGEEGATRFAREVVGASVAEVAVLKEAEEEDLEFVTDPSE